MVVIDKKKPFVKENSDAAPEQTWDNPVNPENAADERDIEQLKRQKKTAEQRKENLTDNDPSTQPKN